MFLILRNFFPMVFREAKVECINESIFGASNTSMLYSMTGFGRSSKAIGDRQITIELRALNSKSLDLSVKLPLFYKSVEPAFRKAIQGQIKRGKVDLYLTVDSMGESSPVKIDRSVVKAYAEQLKELSADLGLSTDGMLEVVLNLPNVINTEVDVSDSEAEGLHALLIEVLEGVNTYRVTEGATLESDFQQRIARVLECLAEVELLAPKRIDYIRKRIRDGLAANIEKGEIDENRFEQELIYYLEKLDLNEEIVRLRSNCELFQAALLEESKQKGKKLGFISQEIGREINTIGSKANDKSIQAQVIQMKDELEKIKEQVLNVL